MIRKLEAIVLIGMLAVLVAGSARAQAAGPAPVFSIGQPPIWRQQLTTQGTAYGQGDRSGATVSYGVFHSLNKPPIAALNPLLGLIGGTLEGYGTIAGIEDAGVRAMATSRMLATSVGADWDIRHHHVNTIVSWQSAIRRGGLLGHGSMVRVDWIPGRGQTVRVGLTAPLFQPLAGRTRPRDTDISIPDPPQPHVQPMAANDVTSRQLARDIEAASDVIAAYSDLYTDDAIRRSHASSYRAAMERSRMALEELLGSVPAARRARIAVLDRIVIPVDSVFGRVKTIDLPRLAGGATADFERWLSDSSGAPLGARPAAMSAFAAWLAA